MSAARSQTPKGQRARSTILVAAEKLLVTRGFHGTSMRDIAKGARVPLATVVYHFTRKERLYAAVLAEIAAKLTDALVGAATADDLAALLVRWSMTSPRRVVLLLRELLDNPSRIAKAAQLPLAPFLHRATELARAGGAAVPELAVLEVVGALSYLVASRPTVDRIVGDARAKQMAAVYEAHALSFARRTLGLAETRPYDVAKAVGSIRRSRTAQKTTATVGERR
ncbi:MAG TPA: TetR family transcriptional regulator [Kofleriaceae bacterium]|jgi:AcrR family transcriptional regulator